MEIGSFIELQFQKGKEWYHGSKNIARLNNGRGAIYYALKTIGCNVVWLPYYQCDAVRDFLKKKNIHIKYYHIDDEFRPKEIVQKEGEAILIVNYYGIMSFDRMAELATKYDNVIIDNSQAFFCRPLENCLNVYSARKFVGVPDGAYVIGKNAEQYEGEYQQGYSSDTAIYLLQRIEYGCEGKAYESRMKNEHRLATEDICRMSKLTYTILDGTDYGLIQKKRRENFRYASDLLGEINKINPLMFYAEDCIPMVYPLVVEDDELLPLLLEKKHFQGHWWSYLLEEMPTDSFEYWLSKYLIPITIDQRYGTKELEIIGECIFSKKIMNG